MQQQEQQIESVQNEEQQESAQKNAVQKMLEKIKLDDFKFELALFFILGLLLGFTLKTEAVKRITVGFNDYKISQQKQGYDFEKIKSEAAAKEAAQEQTAPAVKR